MVIGAGRQPELAENEPRVGISIKSKTQGILKESKGIRWSVGPEDSANGQEMNLDWVCVWRAKCKEFQRKMKDFGGQWLGGQYDIYL